jgi:hypothetical protein
VSVWHAPERPRPQYHHPVTLQDLAILAGGMFVAMMVGIAATGLLPV